MVPFLALWITIDKTIQSGIMIDDTTPSYLRMTVPRTFNNFFWREIDRMSRRKSKQSLKGQKTIYNSYELQSIEISRDDGGKFAKIVNKILCGELQLIR
jgi:hypothetical protein